jgi:hypothetical protein
MKKKVLLAVLAGVAVAVGGFGVAYAIGTFSPIEQGGRQAGSAQAARLTMQVEAGLADPNSDLIPDSPNCSLLNPCPGGALSFSITNSSDFPIRVTQIGSPLSNSCASGVLCVTANSNKNVNGTYVAHFSDGDQVTNGTCAGYVTFQAPSNFDNWPTIPAHATLQVNGTDGNALGSGMIHLDGSTPNNCQGALFTVHLVIQATETTHTTFQDNV